VKVLEHDVNVLSKENVTTHQLHHLQQQHQGAATHEADLQQRVTASAVSAEAPLQKIR